MRWGGHVQFSLVVAQLAPEQLPLELLPQLPLELHFQLLLELLPQLLLHLVQLSPKLGLLPTHKNPHNPQ